MLAPPEFTVRLSPSTRLPKTMSEPLVRRVALIVTVPVIWEKSTPLLKVAMSAELVPRVRLPLIAANWV